MNRWKSCIAAVLCELGFLLLSISQTQGQSRMAHVAVDIRGFIEPGYVVAAPLQQDTLAVVDEYGRPLLHTRVGLHTNVLAYGQKYVTHFGGSRRARYFVRRDGALNAIDTFFLAEPARADFHEGKVWTDTSMILLGFEEVQMDLSDVVPGGQKAATVLVGVIEEQTFDGTVVFRWRSIDHIALTEATADIDLSQNYIDYIHINSIWRESDGDLLVSCRHTDQVIRIDRATGAVKWRLGGSAARRNDFRFENDTLAGFVGFSHQHTALRTRRSTLMMFDNGNLKPEPRRSRIVEYEIDEAAKSVRALRSITPDSVGFIPSMGNVEELPGGNIIVGYGNESSKILAHEIDPAGRIVATVRNLTGAPIDPYRVVKARIGMTAVLDTVDVAKEYELATPDSTTGLTLRVTGVSAPFVVAAERHHTRPPETRFVGVPPAHILPMRWVLRYNRQMPADSASGFTYLSARSFPRSTVEDVVLYGRDTSGVGSFRRLPCTFDAVRQRFECQELLRGEIIPALEKLAAPARLDYSPAVVDVAPRAASIVLAPPAAGVDVLVSWWLRGDTSTVNRRVLRQRPDGRVVLTLTDLQPQSEYSFSARSVGTSGAQHDSVMWQMRTTGIDATPLTTISPSGDTLIVADSVDLTWSGGIAQGRTLLQITPSMRRRPLGPDLSLAPIDTLPTGQNRFTYRPLERGMSYFWRVLFLDSAGCGEWSDLAGFSVQPTDAVSLQPLSPLNGFTSASSSQLLRFTASEEFPECSVQLSELRADGSVSEPVTVAAEASGEARFTDLAEGKTYFWRVIGRGSDVDTSCVFMFRVQRATSTHQEPIDAARIAARDGILSIHSPNRLRWVAVVDLLGRITYLQRGVDATDLQCPIPESAGIWCGVLICDVSGRVTHHSLLCR